MYFLFLLLGFQILSRSWKMEKMGQTWRHDMACVLCRRPEVFCKQGVLRNFTKFTGKTCAKNLLIKLQALLKNKLWHRCFPVNFVKFRRKRFLQNTPGGYFELRYQNWSYSTDLSGRKFSEHIWKTEKSLVSSCTPDLVQCS